MSDPICGTIIGHYAQRLLVQDLQGNIFSVVGFSYITSLPAGQIQVHDPIFTVVFVVPDPASEPVVFENEHAARMYSLDWLRALIDLRDYVDAEAMGNRVYESAEALASLLDISK